MNSHRWFEKFLLHIHLRIINQLYKFTKIIWIVQTFNWMYQSPFCIIQTLALLPNFFNVLFQQIKHWVSIEFLNIHYCGCIISFKVCVQYSLLIKLLKYKIFIYKTAKKCFLFHSKSSFNARNIYSIFLFLCFLSILFRLKRANESKISMMSWIGLHKVADVNFEITQKKLYITLSNFVR